MKRLTLRGAQVDERRVALEPVQPLRGLASLRLLALARVAVVFLRPVGGLVDLLLQARVHLRVGDHEAEETAQDCRGRVRPGYDSEHAVRNDFFVGGRGSVHAVFVDLCNGKPLLDL